MKRIIATAGLLFCSVLPGAAQTPVASHDQLEGRILREINIGPVRDPRTVDIVRGHLASREGEPFRAANLRKDYRQLDALRLFSGIELEPAADGGDVVLNVRLRETMKFLPFLALSITDENGLSLGPAFKGINVLGHGALTSATMRFGGATAVGVRIERPTVTPGRWAYLTQVDYQSRRNELFHFDEKAAGVRAKAGWNLTDRVQAGGRFDLNWFDTGPSGLGLSPDGTDWLPVLGGFVAYNSLDSLTNPAAGWFGQLDLQRQGGDANARTVMLDIRRYQPLAPRSTLSLAALGVLQSGTVGTDIPEYNEFGIGGGNSVRGWALGSRVGKNQAIGTIEYLYTLVPVKPFTVFGFNLYGGIQAAAFGDVGLAWTDHLSASDAIDGYGVGLRLLFPFVDVVRLDFAFGEPGGGVAVTFGITLKADKQRDRVR